jgi:hypothetical protein
MGSCSRKCFVSGSVALALLCAVTLWEGAEAFADPPDKILVLPFYVGPGQHQPELRSFAQHANNRIRAAIGSLGEKFSVMDERLTENVLAGGPPPTTDEQARSLATKSDADLVIYGFLGSDESQYYLKGVMWDLHGKRASVSTDLKVSNIHGLPSVLQVFVQSLTTRLHGSPRLRFYQAQPPGAGVSERTDRPPTLVDLPQSQEPWRSPAINGALSSLDVGDMDGDGKHETVFLQPSEISISRFDKGSLRTLTQFSESPAGYLSVEVDDLDGDGISELILINQTPAGLESSIAKYINRNFKVTQKFPNTILRSIRDPSDPSRRVLVGQKTDAKDMFDGQVVTYRFNEGRAEEAGMMQLPPGTLLLSYASGRLGRPGEFVQVILNQDQRLMVFDPNNRLLASVPERIYGLNRRINIGPRNRSRSIAVPGRLLIADTDGDGENEVLVIKQRNGTSMIQGLTWTDNALAEKWKTIPNRGIISDFCIRDFKNEGIRSLVILLVTADPFSILTGPRSVIYAHDLIP